jgi:hypothetical protein
MLPLCTSSVSLLPLNILAKPAVVGADRSGTWFESRGGPVTFVDEGAGTPVVPGPSLIRAHRLLAHLIPLRGDGCRTLRVDDRAPLDMRTR